MLFRSCKGRGGLGYTGVARGKFYDPKKLDSWQGDQSISDAKTGQFIFQYPLAKLPLDMKNLRWHYDVVVQIKEGAAIRSIRVNDLQPSEQGVTSEMNLFDSAMDGKLVVKVTADTLKLLVR